MVANATQFYVIKSSGSFYCKAAHSSVSTENKNFHIFLQIELLNLCRLHL